MCLGKHVILPTDRRMHSSSIFDGPLSLGRLDLNRADSRMSLTLFLTSLQQSGIPPNLYTGEVRKIKSHKSIGLRVYERFKS